MNRKQWMVWRWELYRRLCCAMARLPLVKKHAVWNAYNRVCKRRGGTVCFDPPTDNGKG